MPSVVIVGAGVFGSALARQLAGGGWDVTLLEQESPGWRGSSSGGESRLIRWSHGSEDWYMRSARRARELWREIDPSLVVDTGMAWFAHGEGGWESESERAMQVECIDCSRLDVGEAQRLFPSLAGDDLEWVLFEPDAGVIRAGRAVQVLAEQAREAGARVERGRAFPDGARVQLEAGSDAACALGDSLEADHVVWACGPWLAKLFSGLAQLRVTRQVVVFFEVPEEWRSAPGWVDYDGSFYGHGDLGDGFKAAPDAEGPPADPDALDVPAVEGVTARQTGDTGPLAQARDYVSRRFPALADAPVRAARACPYELTADTHFIAAPHPEHPEVWLLGGGSGHGFKHAPALAERMEAWLTGAEPPDARFRVGEREPDRSLRTAGARATPGDRQLRDLGA